MGSRIRISMWAAEGKGKDFSRESSFFLKGRKILRMSVTLYVCYFSKAYMCEMQ